MSDVGYENLRRGCRLAGRRGTRLLYEHQARSGRDGSLLLTSLELLDRLAALVPSARPPPPLVQCAGPNGRSAETSVAIANGGSWPRLCKNAKVA